MRRIFTPLLASLLLMISSGLSAQVVINEFSGANYENLTDNFGNDNVDWVELYNMGPDPVNLEGYYMTDNIDNLDKYQFPAGGNHRTQ